ncbi:DDB1- and CUL4-associated factor 6-like [Anopheles maculipalpis]|uniref:DDB1- and CUL4-associated factor 6-like n=1 Tax=Anopheles maculipalpis TaxID=1496333 RepID=UPI0021596868|nr:DDB1- and CUL4-associated factor 6-like [Anopheles maculipalpis]
MLPVKTRNIFKDVVNGSRVQPLRQQMEKNLKDACIGRLKPWKSCQIDTDDTSSLTWSPNGQFLLSASNDRKISLCNPFNESLKRIKTPHASQVTCARFMSHSDNLVVSGSRRDGLMCYDFSVAQGKTIIIPIFRNCTTHRTNQIIPIPSEAKSFISCHSDRTVRFFDIRCHYNEQMNECKDNILLRMKCIPTAMSLSPISERYIAVGDSNGYVCIYDRRNPGSNFAAPPMKIFSYPMMTTEHPAVTSVAYDDSEQNILCNFYVDSLYLFDVANHSGLSDESVLGREPWIPINDRGIHNSPFLDESDWIRITRQVVNFAHNFQELSLEGFDNASDVVEGWFAEVLENDVEIPNDSDNDEAMDETDNHAEVIENDVDILSDSDNAEAMDETNNQHESQAAGRSGIPTNTNEFLYVKKSYKTRHKFNYRIAFVLCHPDPIKQLIAIFRLISFINSTGLTDVGFWGNNYVLAGSDSGNVFFWDKRKTDCIMTLIGNRESVTTVQPHPSLAIFATGGADGLIRVFMPLGEYSLLDDETIPKVQKEKEEQLANRPRLSGVVLNYMNSY